MSNENVIEVPDHYKAGDTIVALPSIFTARSPGKFFLDKPYKIHKVVETPLQLQFGSTTICRYYLEVVNEVGEIETLYHGHFEKTVEVGLESNY